MCFYNSMSKRAMDLAKRYGRRSDIVEMAQEIIDEQYKITAFTHPSCAIITPDSSIRAANWGLIPGWTKTEADALKVRKMTLNARAETVFSLPSFRVPIIKRRCLIPSTGYFEFHHEGKEAIPYYIFLRDESVFSLGGVYEVWENSATGDVAETFSVITVPANALCKEIHNGGKNPGRMPLIIPRENEERWLDARMKVDEIVELLVSYDSGKMDAYPVAGDFLKKGAKDKTVRERAA